MNVRDQELWDLVAQYLDENLEHVACGYLRQEFETLAARPLPQTTLSEERREDECAPYLKEGETPVECIARNRKDAEAVFLYYDDAQRWRKVQPLLAEIETEFVRLEDLAAWIRKMQDSLRDARAVLAASRQVAVGWKLVPEVPTQGMLDAADKILDEDPRFIAAGYHSMLAAAPSSESLSVGESQETKENGRG